MQTGAFEVAGVRSPSARSARVARGSVMVGKKDLTVGPHMLLIARMWRGTCDWNAGPAHQFRRADNRRVARGGGNGP
jgi:hypothetical protein